MSSEITANYYTKLSALQRSSNSAVTMHFTQSEANQTFTGHDSLRMSDKPEIVVNDFGKNSAAIPSMYHHNQSTSTWNEDPPPELTADADQLDKTGKFGGHHVTQPLLQVYARSSTIEPRSSR